MVAGGSSYSPKFLELAGPAAEGVYTMSTFFPDDPRPEVQDFGHRVVARYGTEPDLFNAFAYDTMVLWARLVEGWGPTREAMQAGLLEVRDVPSVIYGRIAFDPQTRRVAGATYRYLVVRGGKFTAWNGAKPA